ncbi:MAG: hypothetical protein U5O39_13005 [Gammaproteobacteria bacterium]|nr:hypothetical protein [Gammaproteobacteria bacterium]
MQEASAQHADEIEIERLEALGKVNPSVRPEEIEYWYAARDTRARGHRPTGPMFASTLFG